MSGVGSGVGSGAASAICREGHLSDEPDYCSVCGAAIVPPARLTGAAGGTPIPVPRSAVLKDPSRPSGPATCPSCGEVREDPDGRFCEVCRFDFFENRPGPPPAAKAVSTPIAPSLPARVTATLTGTPAPPQAVAVGAPVAPASAWELVIAVDAALDTEPDPDNPCPVDRPEIVMLVDKPDMLVGRHDETRAIHPEVSLHDPGASRRHAKFVIDPDGGMSLQDLASTNGSQVNGEDVPPGTKRRLRDGDRVTLGRWTRITLRGKA
jgi:hypothetical protein